MAGHMNNIDYGLVEIMNAMYSLDDNVYEFVDRYLDSGGDADIILQLSTQGIIPEIVELSLTYGANPDLAIDDAVANSLYNPSTLAYNKKILELLVEYGANVENIPNDKLKVKYRKYRFQCWILSMRFSGK